jgi:protein TonB
MTPYKLPGADHRKKYYLHLEIGLLFALLIVGMAFQFRWTPKEDFQVTLEQQEVVHLEEIKQTEQKAEAPLPPPPSVPVEVPNNQVIEQEELNFDASLDLDAALDVSEGPPPPPEESDAPEEKKDEIFVAVETRPDCGGIESLQEHLEYPRIAERAGVEGNVYVQFVVSETGAVTDPVILKSDHSIFDTPALEAVQKLSCTPGKQRGTPVKVLMTLPVRFRLDQP